MLCQAYRICLLHPVLSTPLHRINSLLTIPNITEGSETLLTLGTEVMYWSFKRNATLGSEAEGILCRIRSVIGEGKQRRYEIIENPPTHHVPFCASSESLVPIPSPLATESLPTPDAGQHVLAL
jgi:SAGA-associated factor 29